MSYILLSEVPMLRNQFRKLYGTYRNLYMSYILLSEVPMYGVSGFREVYVVYAAFGSADVEESVQEIIWHV